MKLIDQVITVMQAKRLCELGVAQEGCFSWGCNDEFDNMEPTTWTLYSGKQWIYKRYSAYTVAELGMMMPPSDISRGEFTNFSKGVNGLSWSVDCSLWDAPGFPKDGEPGLIHHYTEAECRAELLIILLENKLITAEEVNARLCAE